MRGTKPAPITEQTIAEHWLDITGACLVSHKLDGALHHLGFSFVPNRDCL